MAEIDLGYDYLCGPTARIETKDAPGCGKYFCEEHRGYVVETRGGEFCQLCRTCYLDPRTRAYLADEDDGESK